MDDHHHYYEITAEKINYAYMENKEPKFEEKTVNSSLKGTEGFQPGTKPG